MVYVVYNPTAGAHYGVERIRAKMCEAFPGEEIDLADTKSIDKAEYIKGITAEDRLVVVGGDGTLNHFVNEIEDREYPYPIYCYAAGTGNDFINDVTGVGTDTLVQINEYIKDLPEVEVNGKTYKFINGIGYGIDGYCCEEGDKYREKTGGKAPNYTKIAIKGLLGGFSPVNAKITVDGVTREYQNAWMAPTMNGRYFGGGMMITPSQDRLNAARELSVVAVRSKSRLKILTIFPKIFKGNHVKHSEVFEVFVGKDVKVEFDRPVALQIDGETVLGVTSYKARSAALIKEEATV